MGRDRIWEDLINMVGMGVEGGGLATVYGACLEYCAEGFGKALAKIAARVRDGKVVVFHCTAGKDRAGITAALLLKLAGVSEDVLVENYAASAQHLEGHPEINSNLN